MFSKKKKDTDGLLKRVGFLDSKPFTYLNDQLEYTKSRYIINTPELIIRTRVYHNYLFKIVLIADFNKFDLAKTTNSYLKKENLLNEDELNTEKSINLYIIEENTDRTKQFAKEHTYLAPNGYQQVLIYNAVEVVLDYYNVLPEHNFSLMQYYRTIVYFDLGCHKED